MKQIFIILLSVCGLLSLQSTALPSGNNTGSDSSGSNFAEGLSVAGITSNGAVFSYLAGGTLRELVR